MKQEQNILSLTKNNKIEKVADFIDENGDLNLQDEEGNNALMLASFYGHSLIAKFLIEAEINVDLQNKKGDTALIIATCYDRPKIAKFLLKSGANKNIKNKDGKTALDYARQHHCEKIIELFTN